MGYALNYANRMDLAEMVSTTKLASTRYCLANPGKEYLVYLPKGGDATVDLSGDHGEFSVEWFNPGTGETMDGGTRAGGERVRFAVPFRGDAILYLKVLQED